MEYPDESQPPVNLPTAREGSGGAEVVLPPPSLSAQGPGPAVEGPSEAAPPSTAMEAVERGGSDEGEREREGGNGGSGLGGGDGEGGDGGDGGDGEGDGGDAGGDDGGDGGGAGGDGGDGGGDDGEGSGAGGEGSGDGGPAPERVEERGEGMEMVEVHDVDSDGSEDTVEERGTSGGDGGDRAEGTSGVTRTRVDRWRIEPRPRQQPSGVDRGKAVVIGGESLTRGQSSRPADQGPVGISREDYLEHAPPEVVMAAAADAPGILDAAREAVVESREREVAMLREAAAEDEAARAFCEEFETEEAAEEARTQAEEEERAAGRRVTVVQAARLWLRRGRPAFDAATYAPPVHLFVPSASDAYTPQRELYFGEEVLLDPEVHLSTDCLTVHLLLLPCFIVFTHFSN